MSIVIEKIKNKNNKGLVYILLCVSGKENYPALVKPAAELAEVRGVGMKGKGQSPSQSHQPHLPAQPWDDNSLPDFFQIHDYNYWLCLFHKAITNYSHTITTIAIELFL